MKIIVKNKHFDIDTWFEDKLMDLGVYDTDSFLELDEKCLESPDLYDNMELGLEMLNNSNHIGLVIDCDVDGETSATEMYLYCDRIDKPIEKLFFHTGKQHGLSDVIEEVLESGIDLIIVPDAGTNDFECHKILKENGIDVLVLDHHECNEGYSKYACVINNQLSKNVSNKSLSGAGVVYKFIEYCDRKYQKGYEDLLDLVALGNISDMVDVSSDESRYLCIKGLKKINNGLFKAMITKFVDGDLNMQSVAWSVTPKINAIIRNGTMEDKRLLFEGFIHPEKKIEVVKRGKTSKINMSTHVVNICEKIKKDQDTNVKNGVKEFVDNGKLDTSKKSIIIKVEDEIDSNVTGLVANKLLGLYSRPIIILQHRNDNVYGGSVRSPKIFGDCESFREYLINTGLVTFAQGHANAFGIEILEENIDSLMDRIEDDFKEVECEDCIIVDYEIDGMYLDNSHIESVAQYSHLWGQGLEEPKFLIKNVEIESDYISMMRNKTILAFGYSGVFYNKKYCSRVFREDLGYESEENIKTIADVIGTFKVEEYNDNSYYKVIVDRIIKK